MRVCLLVSLCSLLAACDQQAETPLSANAVEITRPTPGSAVSAGYMRLTNNTEEDLRITRVTSPQYRIVAMHETTIDDGISRMRPIETLEIGARDTVQLQPGSKHLMLMQPHGEFDSVTLSFHSGESLLLTLKVALEGG